MGIPQRLCSRLAHLCRGGDLGYTVIEATVVAVLIGIIAAAGLSGFWLAIAGEQIDGWARSITSDVGAGRQAAVAMRSTVTVTVSNSSYVIAAGTGSTLKSAALPSDISITTTCPAAVCSFDRRGAAMAAGTITLTSASTGRRYMITIEPDTGSVSYQ